MRRFATLAVVVVAALFGFGLPAASASAAPSAAAVPPQGCVIQYYSDSQGAGGYVTCAVGRYQAAVFCVFFSNTPFPPPSPHWRYGNVVNAPGISKVSCGSMGFPRDVFVIGVE